MVFCYSIPKVVGQLLEKRLLSFDVESSVRFTAKLNGKCRVLTLLCLCVGTTSLTRSVSPQQGTLGKSMGLHWHSTGTRQHQLMVGFTLGVVHSVGSDKQ